MRQFTVIFAVAGLLAFGGACNMQPKKKKQQPPAKGKLKAEPKAGAFTPVGGKTRPEPKQLAATRANPRRQPPIRPVPAGPTADKAAPLPTADKVVSLFYVGNVEGEVDPCG